MPLAPKPPMAPAFPPLRPRRVEQHPFEDLRRWRRGPQAREKIQKTARDAYYQGQLDALEKLGFYTSPRAMPAIQAHAALGATIGGLGGYAASDDSPVLGTLTGATLGGLGGAGAKAYRNSVHITNNPQARQAATSFENAQRLIQRNLPAGIEDYRKTQAFQNAVGRYNNRLDKLMDKDPTFRSQIEGFL